MGQRKRKDDLLKTAKHEQTVPSPDKLKRRRTAPTAPHKDAMLDDSLKFIGQLVHIFSNFPLMYEDAGKKLTRLDYEYGDLTHAIELSDIKSREAANIVKNLKANRKTRRDTKDFLELSKGMYDFIKPRVAMVPDLVRLSGEMHRRKEALERRTFTPRVLGSMDEAFEKAGITKRQYPSVEVDGLEEMVGASEGGKQ